MREFGISFGALCPTLYEQLRGQHLPIPKNIDALQAVVDAETTLRVHGCLTDSETKFVRKRLMKKITEAVKNAK